MKICLSCEGITATEQESCGSCGIPLLPTDAVHYPLRRGETDAANPLLGTLVDGKYRISSVLGRGGMGTVYRAVHEVSLVPVALKLLHPRYGSRPDYRAAFLAEARKAGRVVHDHCARVLDVGETEDGTAYLAMELAEGETLDEWTRGARGLSPVVVVEILQQICRALTAIHGAGLVHRDLSARNVMVAMRDGAPSVKVLDFGIAKAAALVARDGEAETGADPTGFGNPVFSAPEHLSGQSVDPRADLYSLGVIAYLLLTGTLPVAAHDPREAARATAEGRLRRLPSLAGVPRRLSRLLQQCLQRVPERRPASATQVHEELTRIRFGPRRAVRSGIVALAATAIVALVGQLAPADPFLRPVLDVLELAEAGLGRGAPVRYLRSADLAVLRFHFGGFAPDRLQAEVLQGGPLLRQLLDPVIDRESGWLVLSTAQSGWGSVVDGMAKASADGAVDLQLLVQGLAPLGGVRLLLDDTPPVLEPSLVSTGEGEAAGLRGDTRLDYRLEDRGGVVSASLTVTLASGRQHRWDLPLDGRSFAIGRALSAVLPGVTDHGPGDLSVTARDRAGNETTAPSIRFARCDLLAPEVQSVTAPSGEAAVSYTGAVAAMRILLSETESGLRVRAVGSDGSEHELFDPRPAGGSGWIQVQIHGRDDTPLQPFHSGPYTFVVTDHIGNRSESVVVVAFRNRRLDPALLPVETDGSRMAVVLGTEVVAGPTGAGFEFSCNEAFRIEDATLSTAEGATWSAQPKVTTLRPGRNRLDLPPMPPGSYRLDLRLEESAGGVETTAPIAYSVRILPVRIELRLPQVESRFLPALVDAGVLQPVGEALQEGHTFRIDPALRPFVRGQLWVGGSRLSPIPLPDRSDPEAPFLPEVRPVNGRNVMALELHDVLGRPVAVLAGERPVATIRQGGVELAVIAEFHFHSDPPVAVGEEVRVEHGQPARFEVRSPLPFADTDRERIRLVMGQSETAASRLRPSTDGGTLLTFQVPYTNWRDAADLTNVGREEFGQGLLRTLDVSLVTPAGSQALQLRLRTHRSSLVPVRLAELRRDGGVPDALSDLRLLPVLAPIGDFDDPVPPGMAEGLFRSHGKLVVRNMSDVYLQDREVTRGQYAAIVRAFLELPAALRPEWQRIVHADDPLGEGRLDLQAMTPAIMAGRQAEFADLVAQEPDRAVAGVDWFQAFTACRMLGTLLLGDPDLLRLPLGCELELAAFGTETSGVQGAAARGGGVSARAFAAATPRWRQPGWAPTAVEVTEAGDLVPSNFPLPMAGLDFGVREWVLDLPEGGAPASEALLREWMGDHGLHLVRVAEFAAGKVPPVDLAGRLRTFGVLRGLALGDDRGIVAGATGEPIGLQGLDRLPADLPGVVRAEQMRRDGRDLLPERLDPRLLRTGFRLAGGAAFVLRVRGR